MGRLNLNSEEKAFLRYLVNAPDDRGSWILFYGALLLPPVLFAAYGAYTRNFLALAVGFLALFAAVVWRLWSDYRAGILFGTILNKLMDHEEREQMAEEAGPGEILGNNNS